MNTKKKLSIAALSLIAVLGVVAATPGRAVLTRLLTRIVPTLAGRLADSPASDVATAAATLDVEQRARAAHGWTSVANSVARGTIIYYDAEGRATGQYAITIARGYPDRVRVEIDRGQSRNVSGFDQSTAWRSDTVNLKDSDARDIRAVARICPERLFVTRAAGSPYREAGLHFEDSPRPQLALDWSSTPEDSSEKEAIFDQVEITDSLGPAATRSNPGDVRRVYYYVDRDSSMVSTARWLEPVNPRASIDDDTAAFTDIRIDFADWRVVDGVKWPFRVTHSTGGRVDFRIVLDDVKLNQPVSDTLFQQP